MLDEFSSTKISQSKSEPGPTSKTSEPTKLDPLSSAAQGATNAPAPPQSSDEDDFAKQLQAGMAEMMREFESNPEMAKQFEEMMTGQFPGFNEQTMSNSTGNDGTQDSLNRANDSASQPQGNSTNAVPTSGPNFQDSIKRTMDRMRESNASASAASATSNNPSEDDFMTQMLNEIAQANGGADGNPEDAFSNMLLGMMEQLTNKEILYEPMKELDSKFPDWLSEREPGKPKASTITNEARAKYKDQQSLVHEIVQRFEQAGYSDQNAGDREFIVERMQKMQAAGAPPSDLVGDMGAASEMLVSI